MTLEAGLQYFSVDNKFMARAVGFGRRVQDVIFFYFNPVTFQAQYINQDKQKDHGIELEASYSPFSQLQLKAFYTYTTGKINTIQNGKDTTYFNLLRRPKQSFGFNAGYKVCSNLFISSNLQAVGKREDAYFDANSFSTVYTTLDNYYLLDFYVEYGLLANKLKLFADLRNVTNSKYTEVSGFATLGFNGYGGVRFNF
jgi:vitamin B12 transporter